MKKIINRINFHLFSRKITIVKWQLNLFGIFFLTVGFVIGTYITFTGIGKVFATSASTISKDTDTDFSQGTLSSTEVSGSGSSSIVELIDSGIGYNYKIPVTVSNSSGTITDYQIKIVIDTATLISAGKMQPDCDDIYVKDGNGNKLNHSIQNLEAATTCNTSATIVWTKVPSLPNGDTVIEFYYDNSSATNTENPSQTFIWYDDFSSDTKSQYLVYEAGAQDSFTYDATNDRINFLVRGRDNSKSYLALNVSPDPGIVLEADWAFTTGPYEAYSNRFGSFLSSDLNAGMTSGGADIFLNDDFDGYSPGREVITGNAINELSAVGTFPSNTYNHNLHNYWFHSSVSFDGSDTFNLEVWENGTNKVVDLARTVTPLSINYVGVGDLVPLPVYGSHVANTAGWVDNILVRKYSSSISVAYGSEQTSLPSSGTWETATDSNVIDLIWNGGWGDGTNGSTAFSATVGNVGANSSIVFSIRTAASAEGLSAASYQTIGTASSGTTFSKTKADLDALGLSTGSSGRYAQIKATLAQIDNVTNPSLDNITLYYLSDNTAPETNISSLAMLKAAGGDSVASNGWTNGSDPYFSWTAGEDTQAGLKGYCLYLGTDSAGNPATSKGLLGTSPISTTGTTCQFIVSSTNVDLATAGYQGGSWLTSSSSPYYLNIKPIDNANNIHSTSIQHQFRFDNTPPTNSLYVSLPGDFISTKSATLVWPTSGSDAPSDALSGIAGLQYKIGSGGTWYGDLHSGSEDSTDLLTNDGVYALSETPDFANISEGSNTIYLRTIDNAGNISSTSVTGTLKINTTSPSAPQTLNVTPSSNTNNSFAFSWAAPSTYTGIEGNIRYCYSVNTLPSSTSCTWTEAGVTSLSADSFANQPGTNTFYLVAKDEAGNVNYETYSSTTFSANTSAPGIPQNTDIADVSVKSTSSWKLAISWEEPASLGAGVANYQLYHSTDGTSYTLESTTTGISYVDTSLTQTTHYYKLKACDSANNCGAFSSVVELYPDGKFAEAAALTSDPTTSSITTKNATISWTTGRNSDSKIQYGLSSGSYYEEEPSKSTQETSHAISLTNLNPGTTYYYKAKWTDEDGNTGTSDELTFTTNPAPTIKDSKVENVNLDSAIISFTTTGSSKVKIYYGTTTSFGGVKEISTATEESTYTSQLTGLDDGAKYYYKINGIDSDGGEYEGTILDFETLPRPRITNVRLQQIANSAQPSVLVSWETNTAISSIVSFYPSNNIGLIKDEVKVLLEEGEHQMVIKGLFANTDYILIVKGRDKIGNEATSDSQRFTTATDTRPPKIVDLRVESTTVPQVATTAQETSSQLIISWNTDEPSTSQVEYGEGTGTTYSSKTQKDESLTYNHVVIISGLNNSQVYHLKAISEDNAGNTGKSVDSVTITSRANDNALDLVITSLQGVFGF